MAQLKSMRDRDSQATADAEDARADLMATLAAGRELGPEMDHALADSYLRRNTSAAARRHGEPFRIERLLPLVGMVVSAVVFLAILAASGWHAWWLFWIPMSFGGWWWRHGWWGWGSSSHDDRQDQRQAEEEARRARYERQLRDEAARLGYTLTPAQPDPVRQNATAASQPAPSNTTPSA